LIFDPVAKDPYRVYRLASSKRHEVALMARFDRIFTRQIGRGNEQLLFAALHGSGFRTLRPWAMPPPQKPKGLYGQNFRAIFANFRTLPRNEKQN
jgi:hypothetical protein